MEFLGIQMQTWHDLVVELHTGIVVFIILALLLRMYTDLGVPRGSSVSSLVNEVRIGTDFVVYLGSITAVIFLLISGVTGYLIYPYSTLVSQPIYLNKAFIALGALYFWTAFAFVRFWSGPSLWKKRGLYTLEVIIAFFGLLFTTIAGSLGAELSIGQSVLDPVYKTLSLNFHQITLQMVDVEATAAILIVAIIVAAVLKPETRRAI